MQKRDRKLALSRETLHRLEARELASAAQVAGAAGTTTTNYWFCVTTTLGPPPSGQSDCTTCQTD